MAENQQEIRKQEAPSVLSGKVIESLISTDKLTQGNDHYRGESVKRYEAFGEFVESGADLNIFFQKNSLHDLSQRWANFSGNPQVREVFGEKINKAEEVLGKAVFKQLCAKSTEDQAYAYTDMADLQNPAIAPFYILESIGRAEGSVIYLRKLHDYLSSFSSDKLKELKESDIPGVKEIAEVVLSSDKENLEKPETLGLLKKQAVKLVLQLFGNGESQERLYIAKRWPQLLASDVAKDDVKQILNNSATPIDVIGEFFLYSDIFHNRSSAELFMDYAGEHDNEAVKSIFARNSMALANFVIGRGFPEGDLALFSRMYNLGKEDIRQGLELAVKEKETTGTDVMRIFDILMLAELAKDGMPALLNDLHRLGYTYQFSDLSGIAETNVLVDINVLDKLLKNKDTHIPFLEQLRSYGYILRSDDLDNFEEALKDKDKILNSLSEIRKYKKDFEYRRAEDPYALLAQNIDYEFDTPYESYVLLKNDLGNIPRRFSDPLLKMFTEKKGEEATEAQKEHFNKYFDASVAEALKKPELAWFYSSGFFLRSIANNPDTAEYMINFPHTFSRLFNLLDSGGSLDTNRNETIHSIFSEKEFSEKDIEEKVQKLLTVFGKENPYWKQLYWFTNRRLGKELLEAEGQYPIKNIVGIPVSSLVQGRPERLRVIVKDEAVLKDLIDRKTDYVPFASLSDVYKKLVFRDYLRRAVEESRDENKKREADIKNRRFLQQDLKLEEGDYFHGTGIDRLSNILASGNLSAEALGGNANKDNWPFHVDFSVVTKRDVDQGSIFGALEGSIAAVHATARYDEDNPDMQSGIFLIMRRKTSDFEKGINYINDHGLILGAVPSTATDAIVLRDRKALKIASREIAENGFYIPVYDISGEILFKPEDYDATRIDRNIANTPVEIWDNSLKTGEQKGLSPGAEFTVPGKNGPERFYVKFQTAERGDRVWSERLADSIYAILGISVPETKVVKIDKGYAHASKIIEDIADGTGGSSDWKKGYLADCLLANWDILSTLERNTVNNPSSGQVFRIDNGGALLYRAQGQRKEIQDFSETVKEVGESSSVSPSKMGISREELKNQAQIMAEKLTEETIDDLIDKVRLGREDREYLKRTIRKRRDYIVDKFLL